MTCSSFECTYETKALYLLIQVNVNQWHSAVKGLLISEACTLTVDNIWQQQQRKTTQKQQKHLLGKGTQEGIFWENSGGFKQCSPAEELLCSRHGLKWQICLYWVLKLLFMKFAIEKLFPHNKLEIEIKSVTFSSMGY